MRAITRVTIVALALMMVAPSSFATWYGYGDFEPNAAFDDEDFLWFDAPEYGAGAEPTQKRIYFNAFQTNTQVANPNVGALETQFNSVPELFWDAMLGVWVDCNDDGYVGMVESAIEEYRNELLTDKSRCPDGSAHNQDGWVTELLWIGTNIGGINKHRDPRILVDPQAMVWGDQGKSFPDGLPGGSCALGAFPKGMFQRTGGLLDYADCLVGLVVGTRASQVYNQLAPIGPLPPLEDERRWDEEGHPLNVETFGGEDANNTVLTTQDCSQDTILRTTLSPVVDPLLTGDADELTEDPREAVYSRGPRPLPPGGPGVNPGGNLPGTWNRTYEDANIDGSEDVESNCDTYDDYGHDFYGGIFRETETTGTNPLGKTQADQNFNFTAKRRGGGDLDGTPLPTKGGPVYDLGVFALGYWNIVPALGEKDSSPTRWISEGGYASRPRILRSDLGFANASYWTFYAFVGSEALKFGSLPSGTTAEYAAPFCPDGMGEDQGVQNGWQCDPSLWYRNSDGSEKTYFFTPARPGQPYNLRDTDCFDGTVMGETVSIETAGYGERPCGV